MTTGKWLGLATLAVTEVLIIFGVIIDRENIVTYVSLQVGVFSAVWGILGYSGYQKRKINGGHDNYG